MSLAWVVMELFKTDRRLVSRFGPFPGMESSEVEELFRRRPPLDGMPIVLDEQMRPVEPVSSWFRSLALAERDVATMRAYAYAVLRLMDFLRERGSDLLRATETDLLEFRRWRTREQDEPIQKATWEKESAAINGLYGWLVARGDLRRQPWRLSGRRDTLRNGVSRDLKVRHLTLEQYLYFRDVGLGGQTPQATLDMSFRGWCPHRNRAGAELALLTGMRLQEWSTILLPEVGLDTTQPVAEPVEFRLEACAKFRRPRTVYVPADAQSMIGTYLLLERREIVDRAQKTLKARRDELFVVDRIAQERGRLHGVLDGRRVSRVIAEMPPGLRRNTVLDTGEGLEPLGVFLGSGGRMLLPSSWDKARWRAWTRMRDYAKRGTVPMLPRTRWLFHDMRHTFALRLLIYLTREAMADGSGELPMSTLLDHMTYNPLLIVQRRLGHASPASTYRYVKYLKDPMREVDEAFRGWTAAGGASYAEIARTMLRLDGDGDATPG